VGDRAALYKAREAREEIELPHVPPTKGGVRGNAAKYLANGQGDGGIYRLD